MGIPLRELLKRVTHRELLTYLEKLKQDWNKPSRTDYYLMQIVQEIGFTPGRFFGINPTEINLNNYKIPFDFKSSEKPKKPEPEKPRGKYDPPGPLTKEQIAELQSQMAKQDWLMRLGKGKKHLKDKKGRKSG